ncbi:MAG: DedA family protein [Anaerolineae bacterium]|jgi:membrane-associated protein|nr:DedA family protein [Ardenticatenia bacterium]HRA18921.1 DedA family protein [Anaerolineae bacterium]
MNPIDFILHIDEHLVNLVNQYGSWTYGILFAIIFVETGLVIMPLLPGDSLLFAAGALVAGALTGGIPPAGLSLLPLLVVAMVAAILGDSVNYWIGRQLRERVLDGRKIRFVKQEHLDKTHGFYEKHGPKAIILARFVPIVRTFAPFVAGVGEMTYGKFMTYNVVGGVAWVLIGVLAGYWFGGLPVVQHNFELVLIGIVVVSVLPMVWEIWKDRRAIKAVAADLEEDLGER